jgi:phosphohistidine phosphatase
MCSSGPAGNTGGVGTDTARTLLVLRHAKAAGEPGVHDEQRPLTGRGRRNAAAVGGWLLAEGLVPDRVLCSTARRTRETWQHLSHAMGKAADRAAVDFDARVYDADALDLLDLVRRQPDDTGTLLTVGHNPASHRLVLDLTGLADLDFPTCALAAIQIRGSWADTRPDAAELEHFWRPRPPRTHA